MQYFVRWVRVRAIKVLLALVALLVILGAAVSLLNKQSMQQSQSRVDEADFVLRKTDALLEWLHVMDLGVRGYALTKDSALLNPYFLGIEGNKNDLDSMIMALEKQGRQIAILQEYQDSLASYTAFCNEMLLQAQQDSMHIFKAMLLQDRGYYVWKVYVRLLEEVARYEKSAKAAAEAQYSRASLRNSWIMVVLFVMGIPTLLWVYVMLRKKDLSIERMLRELSSNNRKLFFDPGVTNEADSDNHEMQVMNETIDNIAHATTFVERIKQGDYEATWPGLTTGNAHLNTQNLVAHLLDMRDKMKHIRLQDAERNRVNEGISQFGELLRNHQHDSQTMLDQATRAIVQYLGIPQGGIFVVGESDGQPCLHLRACYAYDRKKYQDKIILPGEGLVGQIWQEGEALMMTEVPQNYTYITSGLGQATPSCVYITPLKTNDQIVGVMELAGFQPFNDMALVYINKAAEALASVLATVQTAERTAALLQQMQDQAETMKQQEEELRQNMEELMATHESMRRKTEGE